MENPLLNFAQANSEEKEFHGLFTNRIMFKNDSQNLKNIHKKIVYKVSKGGENVTFYKGIIILLGDKKIKKFYSHIFENF